MVDDNEGLLREVEEELRRERLTQIWNKYGTLILTGLALLVAGVAGWKYWQNAKLTAVQQAGMQYEAAATTLANGKTNEAVKEFKGLVKNAPAGGYRALAELQLAGAYLKKGDQKAAKTAFEKVASDEAADSLLRDYATLQAAALDIGEADLSQLQNRLNPLKAQGSPWRANARELVALAAMNAKNYDVAKENLRAVISDPDAAAGIIQRANTMLARIAAIEIANQGSKPSDAGAKSSDKSAQPDAKSDAATDGDGEASKAKVADDGAKGGAKTDEKKPD